MCAIVKVTAKMPECQVCGSSRKDGGDSKMNGKSPVGSV